MHVPSFGSDLSDSQSLWGHVISHVFGSWLCGVSQGLVLNVNSVFKLKSHSSDDLYQISAICLPQWGFPQWMLFNVGFLIHFLHFSTRFPRLMLMFCIYFTSELTPALIQFYALLMYTDICGVRKATCCFKLKITLFPLPHNLYELWLHYIIVWTMIGWTFVFKCLNKYSNIKYQCFWLHLKNKGSYNLEMYTFLGIIWQLSRTEMSRIN